MEPGKYLEGRTEEEQRNFWLEEMREKSPEELKKELTAEIKFATEDYPKINSSGRVGAPSASNWKINALRELLNEG